MKILIVILLLAVTTFTQSAPKDDEIHFFVYPNSVYLSHPIVIFTGKIETSTMEVTDLVLANCRSQYYMVLASKYLHAGKEVQIVHKNPQRTLAQKDSAMQLALQLVCKEKVDVLKAGY